MHILERSKCGQRVFRLLDRTYDLKSISIRERTQRIQRRAEVTNQSPVNSVSLLKCFASRIGTVCRVVNARQRALRASCARWPRCFTLSSSQRDGQQSVRSPYILSYAHHGSPYRPLGCLDVIASLEACSTEVPCPVKLAGMEY
jgi:hypothetical protein